MARVDQPRCLGDDHGGLAAARSGDDEVGLFVGDDGGALLGRERVRFDAVEEGLGGGEFEPDVTAVGRVERFVRVGEKVLQAPDGLLDGGAVQTVGPVTPEVVEAGLRGGQDALEDGAGDVCAGSGKVPERGVEGLQRGGFAVDDSAPALDPGAVDAVGKVGGFARDEAGECGFAGRVADGEGRTGEGLAELDVLDVAERDVLAAVAVEERDAALGQPGGVRVRGFQKRKYDR